jgi:hypothetical protein
MAPGFGVEEGFFPPVSHMMTTMSTARLRMSQDCTFLGRRPGGFGALSAMPDAIGSSTARSFICPESGV